MQAMKSQQRAAPLVGTSPAMVDLKAEIERVSRSDAKVLITGESGCGKELVAQAVHAGSSRTPHEFLPSIAPAFRRRCWSPSSSGM